MAISQKRTHFGRAGEYFAMSEVLLRGWNVAVPVVDVGDDVFVIDDNDKRTFRLQVKSCRVDKGVATFTLSRPQLRATLPIELLYMFMLREESRWRFLLIPRVRLNDLHKEYLNITRVGRGRRPKADSEAKTDGLTFQVTLSLDGARGWGASLDEFLERWPEWLSVLDSGPGSQ
jgi:hypothetical protein